MTATDAGEGHSGRNAMVWIESGDGSIARGRAESVSGSGACVRLDAVPAFDSGAEVSLRVALESNAPTLGLRARVRFLRQVEDAFECGLEWLGSAPQRAALDAWISAA
jgi:hypothetical protein